MKNRVQWLDSLRIYALLIIIIYHFYGEFLKAGFLGLEIFFAISAFLITGGAIDKLTINIEEEGETKLSFGQFISRRLKRLIPALLLMILITLIFIFIAGKDLRVDFNRQLAGVLGFITNWYEIITGGSYESQFVSHVFLHTWSLSIEMHYYIIWAIILIIFAKLSNRKVIKYRGNSDRAYKVRADFCYKIMMTSVVCIIISSLSLILGSFMGLSKSMLYFSDITRLSPFFYGSLAASITGLSIKNPMFKKYADDFGFLKAALILTLALLIIALMAYHFSYESNLTYRLALPICSLLCFIILIAASIMDINSNKHIEARFINILSDHSYNIYLFHWPLFVIFSYLVDRNEAVFLSLLLASITSFFEKRIWEYLFVRKDKGLASFSVGMLRFPIIYILLPIAMAFLMAINYTAPDILSLEMDLWAGKLEQDKDNLADDVTQIYNKIVETNKEAQEKLRKEKICFIGDSVILGLRGYILKEFPKSSVDGKVSRFVHEVPDIIEKMKKEGSLSYTLVLALGNNIYPSFRKDLDNILKLLPKSSRVVVVSPYDSHAVTNSDIEKFAKYLRNIEDKYPYVELADWNKIAKENPKLFRGTDGVHFYANKEGIPIYLDMIKNALLRVKEKAEK